MQPASEEEPAEVLGINFLGHAVKDAIMFIELVRNQQLGFGNCWVVK